ncbi:hypothetical protein C0J52_04791 [Blattella germanica]|nr:hypothetical protein C0J52_04791 [Blattella germanica]
MYGFYRVHYDPLSLYLITRHLNSPHYTDIHVLNRMQFLDDAFNLAQMGLIDFSKVIHLTSYLVKEPNDPSVNGRIWDSFHTTPVMSTEYLNFMVSDLNKLTSSDGKKVNDMDISTAEGKLRTLLATAKAIAEFWFGCLITAKEVPHQQLMTHSMAEYFAYKISSKVEPEWKLIEQFVVDTFVNSYLTNGQYEGNSHGVALIDDFYHILNEQQKEDGILPDDKDVKTIADSIIYQKGALPFRPDVYVERVNGGIQVTQNLERTWFTSVVGVPENKTVWIPITYTTSREPDFSNTRPKLWLEAESQMILDKIDDGEWIILNLNATGFYRVNYDERTWSLLANYLNSDHNKVPVLNRIQLLDDAFHFARRENHTFSVVYDLFKYLEKETEPSVWQMLFGQFNFVKKIFQEYDEYRKFEEKVDALIGKLYETLIVGKKVDHNVAMIQPQIENWLTMMRKKKQDTDIANLNN